VRRLLGVLFGLLASAAPAHAVGARSFKSGPIQITADGSKVWVVSPDHDSVSRIDTATEAVTEFPLPQSAPPVRHAPHGVSVMEDGSEVWVACHDSDRLYVLRGSDGLVLARIDFPWGSGPYSVALSRDQSKALVTLLRSGKVAIVDRATRQVTATLDTYRSPFGIAWMEDGVSAWVTHLHVFDRLPRLSRVDVSGVPRVTTIERVDGTGPQDSASLHDANPAHNVGEGGYLTFRGQLAQRPGTSRVWVPTQYGNRSQTVITPDSILQTTIRQIDLATRRMPNTIADKIIPSALQVHDPQTAAWLGPGWNMPVAGPIDIAFESDGSIVYLVNELSENVLVMPTATPPYNNGVAPSPVTVDVGFRPSGIAVSPVPIGGKTRAYVANLLSRSVSVLDVTSWAASIELRRIAVTPSTVEPLSASFRNGERLFHSSHDARVSSNRKVACGSCHLYGGDDGRAWENEHLTGAHGPRPTQSILGVGASMGPIDPPTGLGQLHRSGDRDEVQDFEHTIRSPLMQGRGLYVSHPFEPNEPYSRGLSWMMPIAFPSGSRNSASKRVGEIRVSSTTTFAPSFLARSRQSATLSTAKKIFTPSPLCFPSPLNIPPGMPAPSILMKSGDRDGEKVQPNRSP
jgi:YVTN family beta-propeller protein